MWRITSVERQNSVRHQRNRRRESRITYYPSPSTYEGILRISNLVQNAQQYRGWIAEMAQQHRSWIIESLSPQTTLEWNSRECYSQPCLGRNERDRHPHLPVDYYDLNFSDVSMNGRSNMSVQAQSPIECAELGARPQIESLGMTDEELAEVFPIKREMIEKLFANKNVFFVGDSLMRAQYKDFIHMLRRDDLTPQSMLKRVNEPTFMGDVQADVSSTAFNGPLTSAARIYCTDDFLVHYKFATRCLNSSMESLICSFLEDPPDVIIMNSCVWDVSVYGIGEDGGPLSTEGPHDYRELEDERSALVQYAVRLTKLMRMLREVLPASTMFIWVTTPPVRPSRSNSATQFNRNRHTGRLVHYGNYIACQIVRAAGYDVVDIDYFLRHPVLNFFQVKDGIHWLPEAVRLINQMLIYHIATSWEMEFDYATIGRIEKMVHDLDRNRRTKETSIFSDLDVISLLCPPGRPFYAKVQDCFFEKVRNSSSKWKKFEEELGLLRCALFLQKSFPLGDGMDKKSKETPRLCSSEPTFSHACYGTEELHRLYHKLQEIIPAESERPDTARFCHRKRRHSETRLELAKRRMFDKVAPEI